MMKLAELAGVAPEWVQPSAMRMDFELRVGESVAATLKFRSMWGSFATAQSADGCWTFKRVGFWTTRVTIRACGAEPEIGAFRNNTWKCGGTLEMPAGQRLLATTNFWRTNLEFQEESGAPLMRVKSRGIAHMAATVELLPRALEFPQMRCALLLGCYLTVMMRMDAAGDAAGAAAAAG